VAVKIKLMRMGKIRAPHYRIVVADARTKRDGRAIETIGKYHPLQEPSLIEVDSDRAQYWLGVGAQPTEAVAAILKVTGDWQRFKGEPGAEGTLRTAAPKADKKAVFEAAAKDSKDEPKAGATTPKKRVAKKAAETPTEESAADAPAVAAATEVAEPSAAAAAETPAETAATEAPAETAATEAPAEAAATESAEATETAPESGAAAESAESSEG
jgi:small subunit ribosomal protein S16